LAVLEEEFLGKVLRASKHHTRVELSKTLGNARRVLTGLDDTISVLQATGIQHTSACVRKIASTLNLELVSLIRARRRQNPQFRTGKELQVRTRCRYLALDFAILVHLHGDVTESNDGHHLTPRVHCRAVQSKRHVAEGTAGPGRVARGNKCFHVFFRNGVDIAGTVQSGGRHGVIQRIKRLSTIQSIKWLSAIQSIKWLSAVEGGERVIGNQCILQAG
jgi:hypothetical protein